MSELDINGEAVDLTIGETSYTYTAVEGDKGFQVTSAQYGTMVAYAQNMVTEHYKALAAADADLAKVDGTVQDGASSYKDSTLQAAYTTSLTAVSSADVSTKTVAERLVLVKKAAEDEIAKLDTAYAALITAAKKDAKAGLELIYAAKDGDTETLTGRENMTNADRASILSAAETALAAATTLNGVGTIVGKGTTVANNDSMKGTSNVLETARVASFKAVSDALAAVATKDAAFDVLGDDQTDSDKLAAYKALKTTLADYGVSVLPYDVAQTYIAKISAATSLPVVSSTDSTIALAKEASDAIAKAYTDILTALQTSIINSYYAEIEKSTSLGTDAKTTAKALVQTRVTNWYISQTTPTVSNFISKTENATITAAGCVGWVEAALKSEQYSAFNIERKGWTADEVYAAIDAKVSEILTGDTVYTALVNDSTTTDNKYNDFDGDTAANKTRNVNLTSKAQKALVAADVKDTSKTVTDITAYKTSSVTAVSTAYATALAYYKDVVANGGTQKAAIAADSSETIAKAGTTSKLIKGNADLINASVTAHSAVYNSKTATLGAKTFAEYKAFNDSYAAMVASIQNLDGKYAAWLATAAIVADTGYISGTPAITDGFYTDSIHEDYVKLVKGLIAGTSTDADVSAFTSTLTTRYSASVVETLNADKEYLALYFNGKVAAAPDKAQQLNAAYKVLVAAIGTGVNVTWTKAGSETVDGLDSGVAKSIATVGTTFASINTWYKLSYQLLNSIALGGTVTFGTYTA